MPKEGESAAEVSTRARVRQGRDVPGEFPFPPRDVTDACALRCSAWVDRAARRSRRVRHGLKVKRGVAAVLVMG